MSIPNELRQRVFARYQSTQELQLLAQNLSNILQDNNFLQKNKNLLHLRQVANVVQQQMKTQVNNQQLQQNTTQTATSRLLQLVKAYLIYKMANKQSMQENNLFEALLFHKMQATPEKPSPAHGRPADEELDNSQLRELTEKEKDELLSGDLDLDNLSSIPDIYADDHPNKPLFDQIKSPEFNGHLDLQQVEKLAQTLLTVVEYKPLVEELVTEEKRKFSTPFDMNMKPTPFN